MIGVPQVFPGYTICIVSDAGGVESGLAPLFLFLLQAVVEMSKRSPRMNVAYPDGQDAGLSRFAAGQAGWSWCVCPFYWG